MRDARVLDGNDREGLMFRSGEVGRSQLGWLLSNQAIRRAAFAEVAELSDVQCFTGAAVSAAQSAGAGVDVVLDSGETLCAGMLVAAHSRFSRLRRDAGISAGMHDFGKTMLVCRMRHELPHQQTAWEWFACGHTLALLPLHDAHTSSAVPTLPPQQMRTLLARDDAAFGVDMTARFQHRLGEMRVAGPRCAYPLLGVYARHFVANRFAVIGDAAVGMHPVTAHGFNFGLLGQETLAREMLAAQQAGKPIWDPQARRRYTREHRRATYPLYLATRMLAADDRRPARAVRKLALRVGARLRPFRRGVIANLVRTHGLVWSGR